MSGEKRVNLLASDLADLHFVATAIIPNIAEAFGEANQDVDSSARNARSDLFTDSSGTVRPVAKLFKAMTDYLQDDLAANYKNLYEVSDALKATVEDLKTSDELSATDIAKLEGEFNQEVGSRDDDRYNKPPETEHEPFTSGEREESEPAV